MGDAAMLGVFPEGGRGTESVFYIDVPTDLPTYHNTPRSPRKGKWDECIFYFLLMGICWMGWLIMICAFLMWTVMGNNIMDSYFGVDRNATSWRYAETPGVPASEEFPSDSCETPQVPVTPRFPEPTVCQYPQAPSRGHMRPQRKVRSGTFDDGRGQWESVSGTTLNSRYHKSSYSYNSNGRDRQPEMKTRKLRDLVDHPLFRLFP